MMGRIKTGKSEYHLIGLNKESTEAYVTCPDGMTTLFLDKIDGGIDLNTHPEYREALNEAVKLSWARMPEKLHHLGQRIDNLDAHALDVSILRVLVEALEKIVARLDLEDARRSSQATADRVMAQESPTFKWLKEQAFRDHKEALHRAKTVPPTCGTCRWYSGSVLEKEAKDGYCHRYPPIPCELDLSSFPFVGGTDTCGEHEPK